MSIENTPKSASENTDHEVKMSDELIMDHGHEPDNTGDATYAEHVQPGESSDSKNFNLIPEDFNNTDF